MFSCRFGFSVIDTAAAEMQKSQVSSQKSNWLATRAG